MPNCNREYNTNNNGSKSEQRLFLECGINPQDAIFEIDDGRVEEHQSFVLSRVLVDAANLACVAKS